MKARHMGDAAVLAVRQGVALTRLGHVAYLRGRTAAAFDALDALCAGDLFVRDGQIAHALMLDGEARPFADVYVGVDGEVPIVLVEGPRGPELTEHAARHGIDVSGLEDRSGDFDLFSLDGPYAWELLGEWLGPEVAGLPYLTFFHLDQGTCFRAGKTGEYGYVLAIPREHSLAVEERLHELGGPFDLAPGDVESLDRCALENAFFSLRSGPFDGLTPLELQLQWRVSKRKASVGAAALEERRRAGPKVRLTHLVTEGRLAIDDIVSLSGVPIGQVRTVARSPIRGDWVAEALLDVQVAHSGVDRFVVQTSAGPARVRTVSPPVINNRSLYVDPRRHSYRYRAADDFPDLVLDR